MEILFEIIFEIFGEIIDATDELYNVNKNGRKWKILIHGLSIFKLVFFGGFAILFILLGTDSMSYNDETSIIWAIVCFMLALMFLWMTRCSIKKYKEWRRKIKTTIADRIEDIEINSTDTNESNRDYVKQPKSDEEFNEWLYGNSRHKQ